MRARAMSMKRLALWGLVVPGALLASILVYGATPAKAAVHRPTGIFAPFANCPLDNPGVSLCIVAHIMGGALVLGRERLPINRTITLQGGLVAIPGVVRAYTLAPADGGETLSKVALPVPGGLTGTSAPGQLGGEVTATPELAGPTSGVSLNIQDLVLEEGVALRLPLKARLGGRLLGSNCYLGSSSAAMTLDLTDGVTSPPGPNKSTNGSRGETWDFEQGGELELTQTGSRLVDNSFAVPTVSGCGVSTAPMDAYLGLPSPSGRNTATVTANIQLATVEAVRSSE